MALSLSTNTGSTQVGNTSIRQAKAPSVGASSPVTTQRASENANLNKKSFSDIMQQYTNPQTNETVTNPYSSDSAAAASVKSPYTSTYGYTNAGGNTTNVTGNADIYTNTPTVNRANPHIVAAAQYASENGIPGGVQYDSESNTVNIGGTVINPEYVSDGIAYIRKSDADNAVSDYKDTSGLIGNQAVVDSYNDEYGSAVAEALNNVMNYGNFTYDPDTDPEYAAYKNQYEREANEAYARAMEEARRSAYGATGATLAAQLEARDRNLAKVTDAIPTYQEMAFERYQDAYDQAVNKLENQRAIANDAYSKLYQSNRDTWSDTMENNNYNLNRPLVEAQIAAQYANNDYVRAQTEGQYVDNDYGRRQITAQDIQNDRDITTAALARGFYTANDAQYSAWLQQMINSGYYTVGANGQVYDAEGNTIDIYAPLYRYNYADSLGSGMGNLASQYAYDQLTAATPQDGTEYPYSYYANYMGLPTYVPEETEETEEAPAAQASAQSAIAQIMSNR